MLLNRATRALAPFVLGCLLGLTPAPGPLTATWLGTAGVAISDGHDMILLDPFVSHHGMLAVATRRDLESNPELVRSWIARLGAPQGTPVIVTHSHFDHALDAPYFAMQLKGQLIGSGSTAFIGIGAGMHEGTIRAVNAGETFKVGSFQLRFLESCHGPAFAGIEFYTGDIKAPLAQPASANEYKTGHVYSVLIEHPNGRILHHSSPCTLPDMFKGVAADTVFLGIYGRHDTLELVHDVVDAVGAKRVIPIHWDNFFRDLDEGTSSLLGSKIDEFYATLRAKRQDLQVIPPELGKAWPVPAPR